MPESVPLLSGTVRQHDWVHENHPAPIRRSRQRSTAGDPLRRSPNGRSTDHRSGRCGLGHWPQPGTNTTERQVTSLFGGYGLHWYPLAPFPFSSAGSADAPAAARLPSRPAVSPPHVRSWSFLSASTWALLGGAVLPPLGASISLRRGMYL